MKKVTDEQLIKALQNVTLAVFDVDGIMTDGSLSLLADGSEIKTFNTLDGQGLKMLHNNGIKTAIITGRTSPQVQQRAQSLGVSYLIQGREDKLSALQQICDEHHISLSQCAYIGDDLPDLAAIKAVAFGASVPNGHPFVISHCDWCTSRSGGKGAAREFCEAILEAQNKLTSTLNEFL
ncbi:HAD hydrolase family protein [Gammaproteobacteria bacterium AS21]|jgi:3-deoxy-D-manno-octulosonate 8-phosphate phosphatase (KDO 8-P phosphatase)